jgi:CHASE3 domain sensor protein
MPSQRFILGTSLAILLVISAASIGLDLKSQSDKASVDRTVGVMQKIADARLLVRRAESVSRGFGLTRDPNFTKEFEETTDAIGPAFDGLIAAAKDNPGQIRLFEETRALVDRPWPSAAN